MVAFGPRLSQTGRSSWGSRGSLSGSPVIARTRSPSSCGGSPAQQKRGSASTQTSSVAAAKRLSGTGAVDGERSIVAKVQNKAAVSAAASGRRGDRSEVAATPEKPEAARKRPSNPSGGERSGGRGGERGGECSGDHRGGYGGSERGDRGESSKRGRERVDRCAESGSGAASPATATTPSAASGTGRQPSAEQPAPSRLAARPPTSGGETRHPSVFSADALVRQPSSNSRRSPAEGAMRQSPGAIRSANPRARQPPSDTRRGQPSRPGLQQHHPSSAAAAPAPAPSDAVPPAARGAQQQMSASQRPAAAAARRGSKQVFSADAMVRQPSNGLSRRTCGGQALRGGPAGQTARALAAGEVAALSKPPQQTCSSQVTPAETPPPPPPPPTASAAGGEGDGKDRSSKKGGDRVSKRGVQQCGQCKAKIEEGKPRYMDPNINRYLCHDCVPKCCGCSKPASGEIVSVDEHVFHAACFRCNACDASIDGAYFFVDGRCFCDACQDRAVPLQKCDICKRPIEGKCIQTEDGTYHVTCFVCRECKQPMRGKVHKTAEGDFLCADCIPKCGSCGLRLSGKTVKAGDKTYHQSCFKCAQCSEVLKTRYVRVGDDFVCGDCHAEDIRLKYEAEESEMVERESEWNRQNLSRYELEWREELAPKSFDVLIRMGAPKNSLPKDTEHVCVLFDEATSTFSCAPTRNPEVAVNLSYLLTAVRVIKEYRREPKFSLDPADPKDMTGDLQLKVYYPDWLEDTVFGEVLFQADYLLKEISFGTRSLPDFPQIKSTFEQSQKNASEGHFLESRAGRQWFVVKSANVGKSADGVVLPRVTMGVEARRLEVSKNGYSDAATIDPRDPNFVLAQKVTELFDQLAEKVPVIGELYSVAKAQLVARWLHEKGCKIEEKMLTKYKLPMARRRGGLKKSRR
mmetsp:Transcript_40252/g.106269  ORF Transcript_40252/g.106269 Transcript_40252/m.106269 type:complete len:916 (-) Transcript_40252:3-2750(-)